MTIKPFTISCPLLERDVTYSRPGDSYVYADLNGCSGTLGVQIRTGSERQMSTISYVFDDQKEFETLCKRWHQHMLHNRFPDIVPPGAYN